MIQFSSYLPFLSYCPIFLSDIHTYTVFILNLMHSNFASRVSKGRHKNHWLYFYQNFYAPNFGVEAAYWFGPIHVCVRGSHFAYGQERLEIKS